MGSPDLLKDNLAFACIISLFTFLIAYAYWKFVRIDPRVWSLIEKLPGPKRHPIIGNAFQLVVPTHEILGALHDLMLTYGDVCRGWLGNQPYVFVANAQYLEKILSSSIHIEKALVYKLLENWLGLGLLTSKGRKWQQRRKLLTPAFHFKILEDFFDVFNEQSRVLVEILQEKHEQGKNVVNMVPIITACTLDIICETAMGEKVNAQRNAQSEYVKAIAQLSELFILRVTRPWLHSCILWKLFMMEKVERECLKVLHDFTESVIQRRKEERSTASVESNAEQQKNQEQYDDVFTYTKKRRLAFLDLLLDSSGNGTNLSDLDIREETDTFMFEGHDTTSGSICWTIFLLACNPECQRKVRNEVSQVFSQTVDGQLRHSDMSKLHYLECAIKEALRLYPSVPFIGRQITQDFDLGNGIILPSGTELVVTPIFVHRDPKYFENPLEYIPERFSHEQSVNRNPYSYIPFSAGPRNCIGQKFALMEEKVVLANVFQHFWVEPMERLEDVKLLPDIVLRPKGGLHVKFTLAEN